MAVFNIAVTGSFNRANFQSTIIPVILAKYKEYVDGANKSILDGTYLNNYHYAKLGLDPSFFGRKINYLYIIIGTDTPASWHCELAITGKTRYSFEWTSFINITGGVAGEGSNDLEIYLPSPFLIAKPKNFTAIITEDPISSDFDWVAWAIKEKSKLDNYKKGYEIKFWTTGKKMSSSAVILGGTLGFSVSGVNYTLDDIINGTLSKEALGKTFAEGMAKCKGIWLRIGGILGAILESSIVKTIAGAFAVGGIFYVSYALFTKLMDYTQSLTGSMDDVSYPGWWTQGTTYTEDSTTGSGMAVVPSTNSGAVDNWENYAYTNTGTNGYVTGATSSGTTVTQGNANLGTVTLATGATVALGIATGTSIPLTVPETTKVGLNILDGQAISLDTSEALASPLPMQPVDWNNNVPPPWMTNPIELHLSDNLSNWTVPNIKIDTPVIPPVEVPDVNVKVDVNVPSIPNINVNVPTIPNIKIDTPTLPNIQIDGSAITLTPPESIPLTAPSEPMPLTFDTTSAEMIKAISDTIALRNELETTRAEADTVLRDLQITNEQTTIDNTVTNNEILAVQHSLHTTKAEGLNYAERSIRAWVNEHSQIEYTPVDGVTLKKGLKANPELVHEKSFKDIVLRTGEIDALVKLPDFIKPIIEEITKEATEENKLKGFSDIAKDSRVTGLENLTKIKF